MKNLIDYIAIISIALITILGFVAIIIIMLNGLSNSEKSECIKWQKEADRYPSYYITEWQEKQCDYHDIHINAPVK